MCYAKPPDFAFKINQKPCAMQGFFMQTAQKQDLQRYLEKAKIKASFKENEKPIDPCRGLSYEECCKLYPERCKGGRIYYFHPDHLGTTTFLTDANGDAYQTDKGGSSNSAENKNVMR